MAARMKVRPLANGTKIVLLGQVVVGKLTSPREGVWQCQWRAGFTTTPSDSTAPTEEVAELWATREIAALLAKERCAYERELAEGENF